jgi:hypothetical protein
VLVPVPAGAQPILAVVEVQRPQVLQADDPVELLPHAQTALRVTQVIARGKDVAGVQAHPREHAAGSGRRQQVAELLEASAQ